MQWYTNLSRIAQKNTFRQVALRVIKTAHLQNPHSNYVTLYSLRHYHNFTNGSFRWTRHQCWMKGTWVTGNVDRASSHKHTPCSWFDQHLVETHTHTHRHNTTNLQMIWPKHFVAHNCKGQGYGREGRKENDPRRAGDHLNIVGVSHLQDLDWVRLDMAVVDPWTQILSREQRNPTGNRGGSFAPTAWVRVGVSGGGGGGGGYDQFVGIKRRRRGNAKSPEDQRELERTEKDTTRKCGEVPAICSAQLRIQPITGMMGRKLGSGLAQWRILITARRICHVEVISDHTHETDQTKPWEFFTIPSFERVKYMAGLVWICQLCP